MKRRQFIKTGTAGVIGASLLPFTLTGQANKLLPDVVWIENGEPAELLTAALLELGGLSRFISKGDVVVIKPNIGWDRAPEYAANTNPDLVAALVKECLKVGAKEVKIFDRTCNNKNRCYKNSQIQEKAEDAGAEISHIMDNKFVDIKIKSGKRLQEWSVYKEYIEADKVINIPVAKHHSLSKVSLGLKNLMGIMGGNRGSIHSGFNEKLIDIDSAILPALTIIDAYRILTANGPQGGNLAHVKLAKTLIASPCIVAADYIGLDLFNHPVSEVGHIKEAIDRGLCKYDINNLNVSKITLS